MAGIYIHIPYCKQACHYCDFHFSTNFRNVDDLIRHMLKEVELQIDYLQGEEVKTIYFGGGTPSAIDPKYIDQLIGKVKSHHKVSNDAEISLESNPDDLTEDKIIAWQKSGINRLSVGVQSFFDEHLTMMNRAHNQKQAVVGLKLAQKLGINNITMDLIYGIPGMTLEKWQRNLDLFFSLNLPHLSAYGLTIEPQTHLGHLVAKHKVKVENDDMYNEQFRLLIAEAERNGFVHYEISNFSKPNYYSRHNTAYWFGEKYVGIGPSSHSFDGTNRQWNTSSNLKYINLISKGKVPFEIESLSKEDQYNEYILTRLRTKWGLDENQIKTQFGADFQNNLKALIAPYLASNHVEKIENCYILTRQGKFLADKISSDLFVVA